MKFKSLIMASSVCVCLFTSLSVFSQSAEDLKAQSLQICEAQAAQLSEEQKKQVLDVCKCTVENTDYDQLIKDATAGNTAKVQEDATKVAEECQAKQSS